MKHHNYFIYILTNKNNTVLYTAVTNDLERRLFEHKEKGTKSTFTARHQVGKRVY